MLLLLATVGIGMAIYKSQAHSEVAMWATSSAAPPWVTVVNGTTATPTLLDDPLGAAPAASTDGNETVLRTTSGK